MAESILTVLTAAWPVHQSDCFESCRVKDAHSDIFCSTSRDRLIYAQINAAKSALHKAGQVVLEGHIKHCVRDGLEHGDPDLTIAKFTKAVERFANMN